MKFKEGEKVVLFLVNGWSLKPKKVGNIFFESKNPFFANLFHHHRSMPLIRDIGQKPLETLSAGKKVYSYQEDLKRKLVNFWQLPKVIKISDRLAKNGGRLWILIADQNLELTQVLVATNKIALKKIGLVNLGSQETTYPKNRRGDWLIFNQNDLKSERIPINPEDIVLYFCDLNEINLFRPYLMKLKYQPKTYLVLTDKNNLGQLNSIIENDNLANLAKEVNQKLSFSEIIVDPKNFKFSDLPKKDFTLINIPDSYFDTSSDWPELTRRRERIRHLISDIAYFTDRQLFLTSCFGQSETAENSEMLPFIFLNKKEFRGYVGLKTFNEKKNLLELYLQAENGLDDVAPTILNYLGLDIPSSMTGKSFLPKLFPENYLGDHQAIGLRVPASSRGFLFS